MATWGAHIRIGEALLEKGILLNEEKFIVGNIGADCGEANQDWSVFTPNKNITHWNDENGHIDAERFLRECLNHQIEDKEEFAFLLGYYVHLLTDIKWSEFFSYKVKNHKSYERVKEDKSFIWTIKRDWYDLDRVYFLNNPNGIFQRVFQKIETFPRYLGYYSDKAVEKQVKYISEYYSREVENLDREYIYLSSEEMDRFVEETIEYIENNLRERWSYIWER